MNCKQSELSGSIILRWALSRFPAGKWKTFLLFFSLTFSLDNWMCVRDVTMAASHLMQTECFYWILVVCMWRITAHSTIYQLKMVADIVMFHFIQILSRNSAVYRFIAVHSSSVWSYWRRPTCCCCCCHYNESNEEWASFINYRLWLQANNT